MLLAAVASSARLATARDARSERTESR